MSDRSAVLLVSVWHAPNTPERLRARLTVVDDVSHEHVKVATVAGVEAIAEAVRAWLSSLLDEPAGGADLPGQQR